ncbi:hypothetical protein [Mesorhizobium captivum]|uniref:hypothetical protein n=1 Tax=Mesorhizobium captivum TaxID=3072319 RepID=UPI002A242CF2|nr:hypothetical protein [Mesorhizobium sp. VK23E]MDX8513573.1 hypothetical protein [Mesorhizobium sp. VK23E]
MAQPNKYLARHVRMVRKMQADGWNVDLIVELALGGTDADRIAGQDPIERKIVRDLYLDALPKKLLSEIKAQEPPHA